MPVVTTYQLPIKQNDELFRLKLNSILADAYARLMRVITPEQFTGTNRERIQAAITYAASVGGYVELQDMYEDIDVPTQGGPIFTVPAGSRITAARSDYGVKLVDQAGNYSAVFESLGSNVSFHDFTINENAQNNQSSPTNVTPGDVTKTLFAIKSYAVGANNVYVVRMRFENCPGVNTVAINSATASDIHVEENDFLFYPARSTVAPYDNSAIYVYASGYSIWGNTFVNLGAPGDARSAIEPHGRGFRVYSNHSVGYLIFANLVGLSASGTDKTLSVIFGNTFRDAYIGFTIWGLTGSEVSFIEIFGNVGHFKTAMYASSAVSASYSSFIEAIDDALATGTMSSVSIHDNKAVWDVVTASSTPPNGSAGISLNTQMAMADVSVFNNELVNCPNIGIYVRQQSGTAKRISVKNNVTIDAGTNVTSATRLHHLWDGAAADSEFSGNHMVDTGATLNGLYGSDLEFLDAGSSVLEFGNRQTVGGSTKLACKSSIYCTAQPVFNLNWPNPSLDLVDGARMFLLNATSGTAAVLNNDPAPTNVVPLNTVITIVIKNTHTGAIALTLAAAFHVTAAFAPPINGHTLTMTFYTPDGGTTWQELTRADVVT
jgi:hypothetical protein